MMRIHKGLIWTGAVALALLWAAPLVRAQSLGELAEKEKERRAREAQAGKGGRVISEDDLKKHNPKGAPRVSNSDGTAAAGETGENSSSSTAAGGEQDQDSNKGFWRSRIEAARTALQDAEKRAQDLETSAREARGKPTAEGYEDALRESEERQARIAEYESAKRDVETARQALADVESEARAAGGL